jgi:hypothetical protein
MKKILFLISAVLLLCGGSNASDPDIIKSGKIRVNEYSCYEGIPFCVIKKGSGVTTCLRIGTIAITDSLKTAERKIKKYGGEYLKSMELDNGQIAKVYCMPPIDRTKTHMEPYLILCVKGNEIKSIQLTGNGTESKLQFSSFGLGDSKETVIAMVCAPTKTEEEKDMPGVQLWNYDSKPFSVEIKDEKVYSIKVWR